MSASFPVAFPSSANPLSGNLSRKDASTRIEYRLLELPLDLCSLIEEGKLEEYVVVTIHLSCRNLLNIWMRRVSYIDLQTQGRFSIKGKLEDEAVFCTPTSTYSLRSISVSNSHVILSQSAADDHGLVIQAQVNEILEVLPIVPKLERLRALLLNSEFKIGEPLPELDGESASNAVYNEEAEPGQSEVGLTDFE